MILNEIIWNLKLYDCDTRSKKKHEPQVCGAMEIKEGMEEIEVPNSEKWKSSNKQVTDNPLGEAFMVVAVADELACGHRLGVEIPWELVWDRQELIEKFPNWSNSVSKPIALIWLNKSTPKPILVNGRLLKSTLVYGPQHDMAMTQ